MNLSNDLDLSGTTHTNAGTYNGDDWSFTDPTGNYQHASGIGHDSIAQATATIIVTPYSRHLRHQPPHRHGHRDRASAART